MQAQHKTATMQSVTELIRRKATIGLSIALIILLCSSAVGSVAAQTTPLSNTTSSAKYPPWPVNLYEFYRTDCPHCQAIAPTIDALARQYPTLHVYKIETQNDANYSLFVQKFLPAYNLTIDSVPTIFIGNKKFVGGEESIPAVQAEVARAVQNGATGPGDRIMGNVVPTPTPIPRTNNATRNATTSDDGTDVQGDFPLPLFITTGIISGLNPCVFSVLIFLMGTIALTGSRARALAIGVAYIATVFFVFFLSALAVVQFVRIIGASNLQLTKTLIGVFLLIVGIVSIKDFVWYNRWFSFKIPTFTKHSISTLGKTGSFIAIIGLGFIATIAALPCTIGPFTYFSTTYLTSMPTMQNNLYTALFSFAFVLPMILVFVAIYAVKVSTDRAEEWRMKSARYMRLIAGLLMVTFGLLLVFKVF
jgi:cytochrome c biogenesis protein CcdA/thiol-disulfide isomerase/thioredoxin